MDAYLSPPPLFSLLSPLSLLTPSHLCFFLLVFTFSLIRFSIRVSQRCCYNIISFQMVYLMKKDM